MYRRLHPRGARSSAPQDAALFESVQILLQPIVEVSTGQLVAAEALARFPSLGHPAVADVFTAAHASGSGADLEAACLRLALSKRHEVPDGVLLAVNVSPDALADPGVQEALSGDLTGVIVEVTERAATDPQILDALLAQVRRGGALIAVDDLTAGSGGLLRLTRLRPDLVKLDETLVGGVHDNTDQMAVIAALAGLSRWIGAQLIAKGVTTPEDLSALAELDVDYAQGWFIAPPARELPQVATQSVIACRAARRALLAGPTSRPIARSFSDLHQITATLAGTAALADLHTTLAAAAARLAIDVVGLSILIDDSHLREVTAVGDPVDAREYALTDYPATQSALLTGAMVEAHINDPHSDAAERAVLTEFNLASVLIGPLINNGKPLGILEFSHRTLRQWTSHDIIQARTLADHVTHVLLRLSDTPPRTTPTRYQ